MFKGKVALVTGASRGIGAAISQEFAKEGAKLLLTARDWNKLSETAKLCRSEGVEVHEFPFNLRDVENVSSIIDEAVQKFSRIDFLINNAGISQFGKVEEVSYEDFDNAFKVNVYAPFFLSKFAIPHLRETKGCVVNISSAITTRIKPTTVPYCMSKGALDMMSRAFTAEMAAEGIRFNSVNPGAVMNAAFMSLPEADVKHFLSLHPMGAIDERDVVKGVMFLCSSPMTTGNALRIDGGFAEH